MSLSAPPSTPSAEKAPAYALPLTVPVTVYASRLSALFGQKSARSATSVSLPPSRIQAERQRLASELQAQVPHSFTMPMSSSVPGDRHDPTDHQRPVSLPPSAVFAYVAHLAFRTYLARRRGRWSPSPSPSWHHGSRSRSLLESSQREASWMEVSIRFGRQGGGTSGRQ